MPNYLLTYHGGGLPETEEAGAQVMAAWGRWYDGLGSAVVDGGNPVGRARTIASNGTTTEGGGPNPVTGYSIIQAESLDAAVELAKACPILESGGSIEVCETFNVT
jgi:hypothetical protein